MIRVTDTYYHKTTISSDKYRLFRSTSVPESGPAATGVPRKLDLRLQPLYL